MTIGPDIVAHTIALTAAHLLYEAGKGSLATARETGEKLVGWLRGKLTGDGAKSLADLQADPADPDNQADLRKRLRELLRAEPGAEAELRGLLPAGSISTVTQTASGVEGSTVIQNTGSGTITVRG